MNPAAGRIGPNAITRVAEVLRERLGPLATQHLFERARLLRHLLTPPQTLVDEAEVRTLHQALREALGELTALSVAREAGRRTADYLLAHRIPHGVQRLLRLLPAALAARVLLAAIGRHAWTFAGSGEFSARAGRPCLIRIRHNPLCQGLRAAEPACDFYAATFERLFQALVHPRARADEVQCEACGDPACVFELRWP